MDTSAVTLSGRPTNSKLDFSMYLLHMSFNMKQTPDVQIVV